MIDLEKKVEQSVGIWSSLVVGRSRIRRILVFWVVGRKRVNIRCGKVFVGYYVDGARQEMFEKEVREGRGIGVIAASN